MSYLQESENMLRELDQRNELAKTLSLQARLHMNLLEWEDAEERLELSLELARSSKDRHLEMDNLVTLITLNYFRNTEDEIELYKNQIEKAVQRHIFHDLQGRLELTFGNIEYDRQRHEEDMTYYVAAFKHYAKACEHMLLFNAQRYEVCLTTLRKRLTSTLSDRIRYAICSDLIKYWREHNLDQKDNRPIQLAELEMRFTGSGS
jgi:tetratricopeptide (TPR) repeat protein